MVVWLIDYTHALGFQSSWINYVRYIGIVLAFLGKKKKKKKKFYMYII